MKMFTFLLALEILMKRAKSMQACSEKVPSGLLTVQVQATSQLGKACADAVKFVKFVLIFFFYKSNFFIVECKLALSTPCVLRQLICLLDLKWSEDKRNVCKYVCVYYV
jgi:hypothetical protein